MSLLVANILQGPGKKNWVCHFRREFILSLKYLNQDAHGSVVLVRTSFWEFPAAEWWKEKNWVDLTIVTVTAPVRTWPHFGNLSSWSWIKSSVWFSKGFHEFQVNQYTEGIHCLSEGGESHTSSRETFLCFSYGGMQSFENVQFKVGVVWKCLQQQITSSCFYSVVDDYVT